MIEAWVLFALASALLLAVTDVIDKIMFTKHAPSVRAYAVFSALVQLAAGAALLFFFPLPPALALETLAWMIASAILVAATYYLFYASVKSGSLARVIPALYVYPLLTLVFAAAFLGERVKQTQALGVLLVVAGVTLTALRARGGKIELRSGIALMLAAAFAVAAINVIEKYVLAFVNPWTVVGFTGVIMGALVLSTLAFKKTRVEVAACAAKPRFALTAFANEALALASYVTTAFALQAALASLVAPIIAVRPIIVLALSAAWGYAFPKHAFEKLSLRKSTVKIAGAVIVAAGAALVLS
jgi:uncharacterized membrane protein